MNKHVELAIQALKSMKGDDLQRAKSAFKNCNEKQMQEFYGQSGKTRAQIIKEYEDFEAEIKDAIEYITNNIK